MCGIAGSWRADFDLPAALLRLRHRGPDGSGVTEAGEATHGHVRLAIIDPTPASAQPFRYRGNVLAYNGELWNFAALREVLEDRGHDFETGGDTEVLAAALNEWGVPGALDHLDGMFCFSWSSPAGDYLVRDRLGKLPLYVVRSGAGLAWSSERRGLGGLAGAAEAVPPAHWMDLRSGTLHRYYSVPVVEPGDVRSLLEAGVRKRMIADVPLCVLLSGGIDSSVTTALAAQYRPDLVAYTCHLGEATEDLEAARVVAKHVGVELREVRLEAPDDAAVERAVLTVEVPNRTAVEIATLCIPLAERIRADGFKVVLSGEAADELFGGYGTLARRAKDDASWREARLEFLGKMGRADFHRVNKSFMAHGIEARMPFCERGLVESVLSMSKKACPPGKGLLKRAVADLLPAEVIRRPKLTFQGGAGARAHFDAAYPSPQRYYNSVLRTAFGRVVRG